MDNRKNEAMDQHFGDTAPEHCENCLNCNTSFKQADVIVDAQKIMSCIVRTGQRYGARVISDVLRGKVNERVIANELDRQSTFGIMENAEKEHINEVIDALEEQGFVCIEGKYQVIKVSAQGWDVLRNGQKVYMKQAKATKTTVTDTDHGAYDEISALFADLEELRSKIAQKRGVPDYVIFSNAALRDMCRKLPVTDAEFLCVNGAGETKLKQYGKLFMNVIRSFKEPSKNALINGNKRLPAKGKIRKYTIPYDRWTAEETSDLIAEYNGGLSIKDIAWGHNRTQRAIRMALDKLREKNLIY